MSERVDETGCDRVIIRRHDDRDRGGRLVRGKRRGWTTGHDDVDLGAHELGYRLLQPRQIAVGPLEHDYEVLVLHVTELPQAFAQRIAAGRRPGCERQVANPRDLVG